VNNEAVRVQFEGVGLRVPSVDELRARNPVVQVEAQPVGGARAEEHRPLPEHRAGTKSRPPAAAKAFLDPNVQPQRQLDHQPQTSRRPAAPVQLRRTTEQLATIPGRPGRLESHSDPRPQPPQEVVSRPARIEELPKTLDADFQVSKSSLEDAQKPVEKVATARVKLVNCRQVLEQRRPRE
jgi:hypothetical protein